LEKEEELRLVEVEKQRVEDEKRREEEEKRLGEEFESVMTRVTQMKEKLIFATKDRK
jgi:hypothetical protein